MLHIKEGVSLFKTQILVRSMVLLVCVLAAGFFVNAQAQNSVNAAGGKDEQPQYSEYRGVRIGMTAAEVRQKLGSPRDKGDDQDFYVLGDKEAAQIVYDSSHKVMTISVDFMNGASNVPTAKTVFGSDIQAKADGSVYKLVRYPKAGYWLSYNRTAGDTPLITVTMQKIP